MPSPSYSCACGATVFTDGNDLVRNASNAQLHSCLPREFTQEYPPTPPTVGGVVEADIPFEEPEQPWITFNNNPSQEEGVPDLPEIQPDQWWSPPLPEGVAWYAYPVDNDAPGTVYIDPRQVPEFPARVAALRSWANEHGFSIGVSRVVEVFNGFNYAMWPSRIFVSNKPQDEFDVWLDAQHAAPFQDDFECPICEATHPAYTTICPETSQRLACADCLREMWLTNTNAQYGVSFRAFPDAAEGAAGLLCSNCSRPCSAPGCEAVTISGRVFCGEHGQHALCAVCENPLEAAAGVAEPWLTTEVYLAVCPSCAEMVCPNCGRYSEHALTYSGDLADYVCRRCFRTALSGGGEEEFDARATMTARSMRIPTIPGRETIRDCGVEIEGGIGTGDGSNLAMELYEMGLSAITDIAGYHFGTRGGFAHVERDSSVDWELVVGPMNMAVREDVSKFGRVIRSLRTMVRDGVLKLDLRAGCHVHVGAERVSLDSAFNLNTIFAYTEDVMFRLGAAKWPIHRALQDSHYSRPVPKATRKLQFARETGAEDARYYALSFANYFNQMLGACRCGAVRYDSWDECTCDLGKCTFEFRVFNTTANPRKLHAYLALCQAMVAKAISVGKITDPADEFPALAFVPKRFKDMTEAEQVEMIDEWQERLTWMFTELPLTDDERASLRYCVVNSELVNVGDDFINNLIPAADEAQVEEVAA